MLGVHIESHVLLQKVLADHWVASSLVCLKCLFFDINTNLLVFQISFSQIERNLVTVLVPLAEEQIKSKEKLQTKRYSSSFKGKISLFSPVFLIQFMKANKIHLAYLCVCLFACEFIYLFVGTESCYVALA